MSEKLGKENWVAMFSRIGLNEEQMTAWHRIFEASHPEHHQDFLEWLGIPAGEITRIRQQA